MKPIVQDGDDVLRAIAKEVPLEMFGTPELTKILSDMEEALDAAEDGVALAAPQIGYSWRIFVVRYDRMKFLKKGQKIPPKSIGFYINPTNTKVSTKRSSMGEGCLSVRTIYGKTVRSVRATCRAQDPSGKWFTKHAGPGDGMLAQAFQHEVDHLNGILFKDHATDLHKINEHGDRVVLSHEPFVFFGTPYVASDTLAILKESGYTPSLIVTSPDAPSGRGMVLTPSETKTWAIENAVPVITPEKITPEVVADIASYNATYGICVAYGKILPQSLIDAFPRGIINIHYSLLPKYRGASPVEAALLAGDKVTGITIQQMVKELDAGDILAKFEVKIGEKETTRELRPRLVEIGARILVHILPMFELNKIEPIAQKHSEATRCGKIAKEDGLLDLSGDAQINWNKYRAYAESPGTYFFAEKGGKEIRVKIKTATFEKGVFTPDRIVPEGKKEMSYQDFIR